MISMETKTVPDAVSKQVAEVLAHPAMQQYLDTLIHNTLRDIATASPAEGESTEFFYRKVANQQGVLATLTTFQQLGDQHIKSTSSI